MVVTEALARGLPVLATAVGGRARGARPAARRPAARAAGAAAATPPRWPAALRRWLTDAGLRAALREAARRADVHVWPAGRRPPSRSPACCPGWPRDRPGWSAGPGCWSARAVLGRAALRGSAPARSWTGCARWTAGAGRRALAVAVATTVCCAWRWRLVARGLGLEPPAAHARSRRTTASQLLNTTLPGGVVGDVHRGVRHGREVGDTGRALRAVAWERARRARSPRSRWRSPCCCCCRRRSRSAMPGVVLVAVAAAAAVLPRRPAGRRRCSVRTLRCVGRGLLPGRRGPCSSVLAVAGHVAMFLVAARTAGVPASPRSVAAARPARPAGDGGPGQRRRLGPAGGRRCLGVRRGRARRLRRASPPRSCTASWCSSRACPGWPCWSWSGRCRRRAGPGGGAHG